MGWLSRVEILLAARVLRQCRGLLKVSKLPRHGLVDVAGVVVHRRGHFRLLS